MYRAMKELNHSQTGELAEYHLPVANAVLASAKPEFVMPKPNVVEPMPSKAPTAPVFPNAELDTLKSNALTLNTLLVLPKPIVPLPTPNRTPAAQTFSSSRTIAAKSKFAASKPNMLAPAVHE